MQQKGMILLMVLIFLLILSILTMVLSRHAILQLKSIAYYRQAKLIKQLANNTLVKVSYGLSHGQRYSCIYQHKSLQYFLQRSTAWWNQAQTCSVASQNAILHYVVNVAATLPCQNTTTMPTKKINKVEYLTIIVHAVSKHGLVATLLQLSLALPQIFHHDKQQLTCHYHARTIKFGILAWRQLY